MTLLIGFLSRWRTPVAERFARTALAKFGQVLRPSENVWRVLDKSMSRFRIQLELAFDQDQFHIIVSPDVFVERPWFLQELLVQMLEANLRNKDGAFAIGRCEYGQGIALYACFDLRRGSAAELETLCHRLMTRMKESLDRWYRDELITCGRSYARRSREP